MSLVLLAFWGFLGAFVYAAPRLVVALTQSPGPKWVAGLESVVALAIGPIGATAFSEPVARWIGWTGISDERALAVVIGLIANPAAPSLVRIATDQLLRRLAALGGEAAPDKTNGNTP